MPELFTSIIGMSIIGGAAILLVLLIRMFLKPSRRICCIMWLLVGLRLIMPFSLADIFNEHLPEIDVPVSINTVYELITPSVTVPAEHTADNGNAALSAEARDSADEISAVSPAFPIGRILTVLYIAGASAAALCIAAGYIKLRLRLRTAVRVDTDIYQSEHIPTPFVLGLVRPRIYIPYSVAEVDIPYVLQHERNHIKRKDHISKAAALAVLAIHWFNPFVWAAYILFCRDIETACDEKVISRMDISDRRLYSSALLACSTGHRIAFCPIAFGEVGVKERIKHIMKYTKPAFARNLLSAVLCAALMLCAFVLPVGCTKADATPYNGSLYESVDINDPYYEGAERIVNEDGTITIPFIPYSNVASDSNQIFYCSGNYKTVAIVSTSGLITSPNEDGRVLYEGQGNSISADAGTPIVWIPEELNADGSDSKIYATLTFTFIEEDGTKDTATVTITSNNNVSTPQNIHALTVSIDDGHTMSLGSGEDSYVITIGKTA